VRARVGRLTGTCDGQHCGHRACGGTRLAAKSTADYADGVASMQGLGSTTRSSGGPALPGATAGEVESDCCTKLLVVASEDDVLRVMKNAWQRRCCQRRESEVLNDLRVANATNQLRKPLR